MGIVFIDFKKQAFDSITHLCPKALVLRYYRIKTNYDYRRKNEHCTNFIIFTEEVSVVEM